MSDRIHERTAGIREMQVAILEMIVGGAPIDAVLAEICKGVERLISGSVAGVTVLDRAARSFERAIFPSLGPTFENAIPGLRVADRPGSCAVAVYHGEVVTSDNIAADERFRDEWRALNLEHGVQSIQSRPVFACDGTSLGTFVIGFRERRPVVAFDEEAAAVGAHLTGLALMRHRAGQEQQLLIGELEHRTRNLFSSIGSLVYFTLQANPDPSQFKKVFEGRLSALSRAHSLVLQREGADLAGLITDILAPYGGAPRVHLSGPPIKLASDAAVAFSLAMHELATNAAKYGALSNRDGQLSLTWAVNRDARGERIFRLQWAERGGPELAGPSGRSGFGRTAIERSLAQAVDGIVTLDFPPQGVVCTIEAPLTERLGAQAATATH